jgi:tetratricopeptide (TPR) repeat protein
MSDSGCLDEGTVVAFLGGRLSAGERAVVERHLATCAACTDLTTYAAADIANGSAAPGRDGRPFVGRLTPGTKVDRYQVLGAIGRGGMGEVYAAYHPDLDRRIALKVVYAAGADSAERWVRLLREARVVARLSHPNVVNVYDAGTLDGAIYIAMEFVEGETIDQWLRSAAPARSWRAIVDVFVAAGRGLAAAHAAGVVHRDFKPQNVMVGRDGGVRVMDFGLARLAVEATDDQRASSDSAEARAAAPTSVTKTGAVLGTPAYMAPEQFQGAAVDARADQFSFCVALHEALYGARPTAPALAHERVDVRSNASNAPARLKALIRRGLAADRTQRYASMDDLLRALERTRTRLRPRLFAVAGGLAVLLVLLGGWRVTRHTGVSCVVPTERLAAAWSGRDDARRQATHRAFQSSGRPTAETSWQRVAAALDDYVGKWSGMYVDSCEATHVRGEQSAEVLDLRTSCLNESLDEVRALTDVLVSADAAAIARASMVARDLMPISRCADLDVLRSAVPLPRDPVTLAAVQRLRATLRTVRAKGDLGNYWAAARAVQALRPEVEALGYEPLLAELLQLLGMGLISADPAQAEELLERAFLAAERVGDRETAAKAAAELSYLLGYELGRGSEGERWSKVGDALVDGLKGNHNRLRGWIANNLGAVLVPQGRCGEAQTAFQRAITLKGAAVGADHSDVAISLIGLCDACTCLGRFENAVDAGNRAVAIVEKLTEPDAGLAGMTYANRGRALTKLARYTDAEADLRHSLEIYSQDRNISPRDIAEPLHSLGEIRLAQGKWRMAVSYLTRALGIREEHERNAALVADTRFALARALWLDDGDRRRARALAVAARDAYASRHRPEAAEVAAWLAAHSSSGRR